MPAKIDVRAMAKPIMSTNVSDIPEILDGCGWITEPENPNKLAETIQYAFDHPVEAKEKGKKAREKCKREYGWEMMEKKLVAIFEKYKTD
jgi:glycosyltransferase involved in cell wall biosynthesis